MNDRTQDDERDLDEYVRHVVDQMPPFTPEQMAKITQIMRSTGRFDRSADQKDRRDAA